MSGFGATGYSSKISAQRLLLEFVCPTEFPLCDIFWFGSSFNNFFIKTNRYCVTALFSVFAYIWIIIILVGNTPGVVDIEEGCMTFALFPILVHSLFYFFFYFIFKLFLFFFLFRIFLLLFFIFLKRFSLRIWRILVFFEKKKGFHCIPGGSWCFSIEKSS